MSERYLLSGTRPIAEPDLLKWAAGLEDSNRIVKQEDIGDVQISTVFLGLNNQFGNGPPLLFETMIFGGPHDQWQDRYSTWDEAAAGHERVAQAIRNGDDPTPR